MTLGILDLTLVTGTLVNLLTDCVNDTNLFGDDTPTYTITVSGRPPDLIRKDGDCQLSIYLFHVSPNRFQRTSPVLGRKADTDPQGVPPLPAQPLSLDLYYLLTAHSASATAPHVEEQQAMSIALKCLHEHPVFALPEASGDGGEFTLTMEMLTADELGRFWQATTQSLRLAVVYKVSVVFLRPRAPTQVPAKKVLAWTLAVDPAALPFTRAVQVFGTFTTVRYQRPKPPGIAEYPLFPAVVVPGQLFYLHGAGFQPNTDRVYLGGPGITEEDVTDAWAIAAASTKSRYALTIPLAEARTPGFYQLSVGDTGSVRSNATAVGVAARVDSAGGPLLPAPAPGVPWQLSGAGFLAGATDVALEAVPLRPHAGAGPPGPGEFHVASAALLEFQPPAGLAPGLYAVRVRVNQVESPPAKWITIP